MKTNNDLHKSVLITGCSSGIGRATAVYLAEQGYTVFATVRKEPDRQSLADLGSPNLIPIYPLDLTRLEDIPPLVEAIQAELRRRGQPGLYALINNAGGGQVAPIELLDLKLFEDELKTRLVGAVGLVQALLPLIRAGHGRILWIMTPAILPTPYVSRIHACDFAVNCITRTLAIELKPWQIPLVQIRCGGIATDTGLGTHHRPNPVFQHPNAGLYRARLDGWQQGLSDFDAKRTDPVRVAEIVHKALAAAKPGRQYSIGHMAGLAAFFETMPQGLTDAILGRVFAGG